MPECPSTQNRRRSLAPENFTAWSWGRLPKGVEKAQTSGRSQAAEVIQKLRAHYPLKYLLDIAGLARSTFFARRQVKPDKDKGLKAAIIQIKVKHPDYGYRRVTQQGTSHWTWFAQLEQHLADKKNSDPASSYTATLHSKGIKKIAQKVGEEAVETALAAVSQDKPETLSEAADLVYHLTVLLHHQGQAWADVIAKLQERHQRIGLHPEGSNK